MTLLGHTNPTPVESGDLAWWCINCIAINAGLNDSDHHVGPAIAALMKLSFNEEYRTAIGTLGKSLAT